MCKRLLFQLRHPNLLVRVLLAVAPADSTFPVVSPAVLHVSVLHQLQHKLPTLLSMGRHFQALYAATDMQESEACIPIRLQPPAVHLDDLTRNNNREETVIS